MAKFIATSSSYFQPFSYDELIKPILMQQEAHGAAQDTYDQLAMETSALENYISQNEDDAQARQLYDNYMTKLQTLQDNLWKNGVTAQTRRDLHAARNAYASDITRLAKAVENRQARSKAYWEARRNDPTLIASADPGLSGLDKYLENDLYGQDYYTYSGKQFASEVAADAQVRANEMLSDPEIIRNPDLQGYLLMKSRTGFTGQEVQNASYAVRAAVSGDTSVYENLSPGEKILADVLSRRLDATGAAGKVDDAEFERLIGYGEEGLSQAIGKTSWDSLNDKVYDEQAALRKAIAQKAISNGTLDANQKKTYNWNTPIDTVESEGYKKMQSVIGKKMEAYSSGPKIIARPDGTSVEFNSPFEAFEEIFNPTVRKRIRKQMYGLDVADTDKQEVTVQLSNGKEAKRIAKYNKSADVFLITDADNKVDPKMTRDFNLARKEYLDHVNAYSAANPDLRLRDISIDLHEEKKLRKDNGIQAITDSSDLYNVIMAKNYQREESESAVLAPVGSSGEYLRGDLMDMLLVSLNRDTAGNGGKQNASSKYLFYKVGDGLTKVEKEGTSDIKAVFGDKPNRKSISQVSLNPEDVLRDGRRTMLRIDTPTGLWEVDARAFGDLVSGSNGALSDIEANVIKECMKPVVDPEAVINMPKADADRLNAIIRDLFGENAPDAKTIARSGNLRIQLRDMVKSYLNDILSRARDEINQNHVLHTGNTSTKATSYLEEEGE